MEWFEFFLLFGVGLVAGFINVMAGGGSTLTLPVLIFIGLDSSLANGTNRIGIILQNIFGIWSFRRGGVHHFSFSFKIALAALPGAIIGALLSVQISDVWFQRILAIVMLIIVLMLVVSSQKKIFDPREATAKRPWLIYPAMLGIGFYGGFIQVGVGYLLMSALFFILKIDLLLVNVHKLFVVLVYTIPAIVVFALTDNVHWIYGLSLAAGTSLGAWWSAKLAIRGGEKIIRIVLACAIVVMALKLLAAF